MGCMTRAGSREMFARVKRTKEGNERRCREAAATRESCPVEQAKKFLRSRGWTVYDASVLWGELGGKGLIVVGRTPKTPAEVLAMAERLRTA